MRKDYPRTLPEFIASVIAIGVGIGECALLMICFWSRGFFKRTREALEEKK